MSSHTRPFEGIPVICFAKVMYSKESVEHHSFMHMVTVRHCRTDRRCFLDCV